MGDDGAQGMLEMKEMGTFNVAQDESSCVVYGMPKVALSKGGVDQVLNLKEIPELLVQDTLIKNKSISVNLLSNDDLVPISITDHLFSNSSFCNSCAGSYINSCN